MELRDYPLEEIDAAIKKKKMNKVILAKKLGRSTNSVTKVINGNETIKSKKLEEDILNELQPELDVIHQAFVLYDMGK